MAISSIFPTFALWNFKHIRQVVTQVRLLSQMFLVQLLTYSLGGSAVMHNPCGRWALFNETVMV